MGGVTHTVAHPNDCKVKNNFRLLNMQTRTFIEKDALLYPSIETLCYICTKEAKYDKQKDTSCIDRGGEIFGGQ